MYICTYMLINDKCLFVFIITMIIQNAALCEAGLILAGHSLLHDLASEVRE